MGFLQKRKKLRNFLPFFGSYRKKRHLPDGRCLKLYTQWNSLIFGRLPSLLPVFYCRRKVRYDSADWPCKNCRFRAKDIFSRKPPSYCMIGLLYHVPLHGTMVVACRQLTIILQNHTCFYNFSATVQYRDIPAGLVEKSGATASPGHGGTGGYAQKF